MTGINHMTYIHYGSSSFEKDLFTPIRNRRFVYDLDAMAPELRPFAEELMYQDKPQGGLWASRAGDPQGWAAWCHTARFNVDDLSRCFKFSLMPFAKVVTIITLDDLEGLPVQKPWKPKDRAWMETLKPGQIPTQEQLSELYTPNPIFIDFEELLLQGVDAIEIADYGALHEAFPLWDCNCLLVMNADVIRLET